MIASLNETHVGRGYDPYNSADQPHIFAGISVKRYNAQVDKITDAYIRRGMNYLMQKGAPESQRVAFETAMRNPPI